VTIVDYRCVCGETISLDTGLGGQCGVCGRSYAADILRNAASETVSVHDMANRDQVAHLLDDRDDPYLGQTLGHYEIIRPLGHGGMGSVYQALDTSLQRYVALKLIRTATRLISDTPQLQRLFQEAIAQARVNHPCVVHIYFVGREGESPFLAMELVGGGNLAERLNDGPLPFWEVIQLSLQLADALRACLRFDIIHGDIKPSNVLLTESGAVKLSDFGLASRLSQLAGATQAIAGTPDYLAPELAMGQSPDVRSDMYSLGVTLFEMTFSRRPYSFSGSSVGERLEAHQIAPIEFPEPWPPGVPDAWRSVLARLLAKSPEERYSSYDVLIRDLRRLRPVSLPTAGRVPRGFAWLTDLGLAIAVQAFLTGASLGMIAVVRGLGPGVVAVTSAAGSAIALVLFLLLQSRWGTTPGKKLFQIRIVDRHGLTPSPTRLAARAVIQMLPLWGVPCVTTCDVLGLALLGQIIAGAANLASAVDAAVAVFARDRRSLHDRFFDTRVVLDARSHDEPWEKRGQV
jgi:uncharacterized RDD family membrane protein YckC